jgi:hypothetical protein
MTGFSPCGSSRGSLDLLMWCGLRHLCLSVFGSASNGQCGFGFFPLGAIALRELDITRRLITA